MVAEIKLAQNSKLFYLRPSSHCKTFAVLTVQAITLDAIQQLKSINFKYPLGSLCQFDD